MRITDLKPYVYQAARALMQLAAPQAQPAPVQAEPVAEARVEQVAPRHKKIALELMYADLPPGVHPLYLHSAPQAQPVDALDADQPEPADLWYLQDTRGYVGNDVLWWAAAGGYTTDVSKAEAFTRDDAFRQAAMRGTDRAWPKAYIDGKTRPAVDMQYIDHQAAMAAAQEGGNAAKEA